MPPRRPTTKRRSGAEGAVWRRISAHVVARDHGICHICKHPGASVADHVVPVTEAPERALDESNLKAAHAYPKPCPTCTTAAGKNVYCNEIKGGMSLERAQRIIEKRTGLPPGTTGGQPQGEREW